MGQIDTPYMPNRGKKEALASYQQQANAVPAPAPLLHDLLEKKTSEERKEYPVQTGFIDYFRDAMFGVSKVSYDGNKKHNPGEPTHWARGKSDDHLDCAARHLLSSSEEEHLANLAWRAMAAYQIFLEKK